MNDLDPAQRSDSQLAAALAAGDASAISHLAERYASALYDFALRTTLDVSAAETVVETALRRARDEAANRPRSLAAQAWLFGISRDEALDALRQRGRADGEEAGPTPLAPLDGRLVRVQDASLLEMARWAWQAARSQRPRDYSLLDLSLRRHLSPEQIADMAGLSRTGIYAVIGRLRGAFEESFAATALYFKGRSACPDLDTLCRPASELRPALRREIGRHVEDCATCRDTIAEMPLAADLFALLLDAEPTPELVDRLDGLYFPPLAGEARPPAPPAPAPVVEEPAATPEPALMEAALAAAATAAAAAATATPEAVVEPTAEAEPEAAAVAEPDVTEELIDEASEEEAVVEPVEDLAEEPILEEPVDEFAAAEPEAVEAVFVEEPAAELVQEPEPEVGPEVDIDEPLVLEAEAAYEEPEQELMAEEPEEPEPDPRTLFAPPLRPSSTAEVVEEPAPSFEDEEPALEEQTLELETAATPVAYRSPFEPDEPTFEDAVVEEQEAEPEPEADAEDDGYLPERRRIASFGPPDEADAATNGEEPDDLDERGLPRNVPLTFTRGSSRQSPPARQSAPPPRQNTPPRREATPRETAPPRQATPSPAPELIRFSREDIGRGQRRPTEPRTGGRFGDGSGVRRISMLALMAGLTLVAVFGALQIGGSLAGDDDDSGNALAALPTNASGMRQIDCGAPTVVDQNTKTSINLESKALTGYAITTVQVRAVSANAVGTALTPRGQGLQMEIDAAPLAGPAGRLDEYRLLLTLAKGGDRVQSECTVQVRAPVTAPASTGPAPTGATGAQPSGTPGTPRPPTTGTPGTPAASTGPAGGTGAAGTATPVRTPPAAGTPAAGTTPTRVP